MRASLLILMFAALAGCTAQPALGPDASVPEVEAVLAAAPAAVAPAPAAGRVESTPLCEVEIAGRLVVPERLRQRAHNPTVFVAIGDCLAPAPRIIGSSGSTRGRFFIEVFAPWGSDLSLCAASESQPGGPSTLYGKATVAMHAEAKGEVEFKDVMVQLAPGPARTFPHHATRD